MKQLIHTPEGVRDVYGEECDKKRYLRRRIERLFRSYGYQSIETPAIEFFDVFAKEVGTTPSRDLYKFIDREGNTLVLRPDFTPAIARATAMYFQEEDMPVRLCYQGNVYINNTSYQGRLKESTQTGIELINEDTPEADAEVIALAAASMLRAGIKDFQVSIGHVGFFAALAEEAGMNKETMIEIRDYMMIGNRFGAQEVIEGLHMPEKLEKTFLELPNLIGGAEVFKRAEELIENEKALAVLKRLENIYSILKNYGVDKYVAFDLGMVSGYAYYTGILVQAYTYGTGDAVIKGGRYDSLMEYYGKKAPAVGFMVEVDSLLNAIERQRMHMPLTDIKLMVLYSAENTESAIAYAQKCREKGRDVACILMGSNKTKEDYIAYGKRNQFAEIVLIENAKQGTLISVSDGKETPCAI